MFSVTWLLVYTLCNSNGVCDDFIADELQNRSDCVTAMVDVPREAVELRCVLNGVADKDKM